MEPSDRFVERVGHGVAAGSQAACYGRTAKQRHQQRRQAIHDVAPFSEDLVRAYVGSAAAAKRRVIRDPLGRSVPPFRHKAHRPRRRFSSYAK